MPKKKNISEHLFERIKQQEDFDEVLADIIKRLHQDQEIDLASFKQEISKKVNPMVINVVDGWDLS